MEERAHTVSPCGKTGLMGGVDHQYRCDLGSLSDLVGYNQPCDLGCWNRLHTLLDLRSPIVLTSLPACTLKAELRMRLQEVRAGWKAVVRSATQRGACAAERSERARKWGSGDDAIAD